MHSLLREMGREIIREITGKEPGKISQLWLDKDVEYVLTENTVRTFFIYGFGNFFFFLKCLLSHVQYICFS